MRLDMPAFLLYIQSRYVRSRGHDMRTHLSKWGHSLAVRIPRALAEQIGVKEGSPIEIIAGSDSIVLSKPGYTLDGLLAEVRPGNLHGETDTGRPVGREEW